MQDRKWTWTETVRGSSWHIFDGTSAHLCFGIKNIFVFHKVSFFCDKITKYWRWVSDSAQLHRERNSNSEIERLRVQIFQYRQSTLIMNFNQLMKRAANYPPHLPKIIIMMVQSNQESRRKYGTTCSTFRSFACTVHSSVYNARLASLAHSDALICLLARSLTHSRARG